MSDTKYAFPQFAFYDRTGIRAYLEKQAEKGWILEGIGSFAWKFNRSYPRKLRYTVVYFPKADMFDSGPGEEEQTFQEFCAHGGWTLAASSAQMQIFYTEREDPVPIETDPVIEVENIHKSMKKSMLPSYWMLLGVSVLNLVTQGWTFAFDPLSSLSSNLSLFMIGFWIIFLGINTSEIAGYYRWHRRAERAAEEDGVFVETRSNRNRASAVCVFLLLFMMFLLLTMEDKRKAAFLIFGMILTFTVIGLILLFQKKLKKDGYDAKTNRTATVIACVVVSIAVFGFGYGIIGEAIVNSHWPGEDVEELPLSLEDLVGEGDYDALVIKDEESILLSCFDMMQVPEGRIRTPRIELQLVKVKVPALYERCLAEMMDVPERIPGAEYVEIDPTPWGAEAAWQLRDSDVTDQWYVLCYADTIVEFLPDWELTAEQMVIVGEKIG